MFYNTTGSQNTASCQNALYGNTVGNYNTGVGVNAGSPGVGYFTGSYNTFLGANSNAGGYLTLTNATAIGANAQVTASNSLVLGGINGVNGATSSTNVGIGTTAPAYTLDVQGTGNFAGPVTFAAGQTFPGTGTITGVTAGLGLSGGGVSGSVTLANTGVLGVTAGTGILSSGGNLPAVSLNTSYTDGRYLQTAGGTMTGTLNLPSNSLSTAGNQFDFRICELPFELRSSNTRRKAERRSCWRGGRRLSPSLPRLEFGAESSPLGLERGHGAFPPLLQRWLVLPGKVGAGPVMITLLAGQVIGGLLMSHYGWLGSPVQPITITKVAGVLVMVGGVVLATYRK